MTRPSNVQLTTALPKNGRIRQYSMARYVLALQTLKLYLNLKLNLNLNLKLKWKLKSELSYRSYRSQTWGNHHPRLLLVVTVQRDQK